MGLYIQNRQIGDSNNNCVRIDPEKGIVAKEFHDPRQYSQELKITSALEPFGIVPSIIDTTEQNHTINYEYIESIEVSASDRIKALKRLHEVKLKNSQLSKSYQVHHIENHIKNAGCEVAQKCLIHGDPSPDNFLKDTDQKMYLIDFEESCFSDPFIDVAIFIIENIEFDKNFTSFEKEEFKLLRDYGEEKAHRFFKKRKIYYQACLLILERWWKENKGEDNIQYQKFSECMVSI